MIKNLATAEHYRWGEICDGWRLLDRADLSVIQERMPPGASETRHVHHRARQLFFVLTGQLTVTIADQTFTLDASDSVEVTPDQAHVVRNTSVADVSFLVVSAPSTRGDRDGVN